jgi:hypothetical protein
MTLLPLLPVISSCSIKPILSEKEYVRMSRYEVSLEELGNGRVMIYNGHYYCPAITCGTTTKINVLINNESYGQINYGEYFIIDLGLGTKSFHLEHVNFWKAKSDHEITIDENTKVLKLIPTDFSHKLIITNELPPDLRYFKGLTN